jgi:crotonobetainyl-CoA:carnitine CoA-transferase CaiB-like acyl-CoA transferase
MQEKETPLGAFRVLDLTQVLSGPHCTQMLADLGADVVKVEQPGRGDDLRNTVPFSGREGHQDYFYASNRSKRSIALDLKDGGDRDIALALAGVADIVVENFAPGTAARLGMGWDALRAVNPKLVYCSISGFGQSGPYRDRPALDPVIQAIAGVMSVTGAAAGPPVQIGAPLADVIAGIYAAFAILGALHGVRSSGVGRYIDLSMQDAMLASLGPRMGEILQGGTLPIRAANENPMRVPANNYATKDGREIALICQHDRGWPPICRALGCEDLIDDARFADMPRRVANRAALNAIIQDLFSTRTADEWRSRLEAERVPHAMVNDYAQALDDAQVAHRGLIRELDHPVSGAIRVVGPPWTMTGPQSDPTPPPLLGQHGADVLRDWLNREPPGEF